MGGYGSGRRSHKQKAEHCKSLDVNRFHREGCLNPGRRGNWVWSRDNEEIGRIDYEATETALVLDYRVRQYGGDWEQITQTVPLLLHRLPLWRSAPLFPLSRCCERHGLRATCRQAVRRRAILGEFRREVQHRQRI